MCTYIHAPTYAHSHTCKYTFRQHACDTYVGGESFIQCAFKNQKGKVGIKGGKVGKNGKPVKEADSDNDDFEEVRESQ